MPEKGGTPKFHGKVTPGIFELSDDGNTLKVCFGLSEGVRPPGFDSKPQGWSVQIYKRKRGNR